MRAIGAAEGGPETVLDAIESVMRGELLLLPTHSWATMFRDNAISDPQVEPSCVGILTERFRHRNGVVRSLHTTHSVAALGPGAAAFVAGEACFNTPCPRDGVNGKLVDAGANILFLGCSLNRNTLIHGVEEWANIPNRLREPPHPMKVRLPDGQLLDCPMHGHLSPLGDISRNYGKLYQPFVARSACIEGQVGNANAILCDVRKMVRIANEYLKRNPDYFSSDTIESE